MSGDPVDAIGAPQMVCGRFDDFDELSELTRGWDLDFHQLDGGASPGELIQVVEPQTSLIRGKLDRCYHQRGGCSTPGVRTFALVEEGVSGVRWCGHDVTETTLMTFHPGGEFEGVSPPSFEVYVLSLSEERLAETAAALGLPEIPDLLGDAEKAAPCDHPAIQDLRCGMRLLCSELAVRPSTLEASSLIQELEFEIPARLLRALASSRVEAPRRPSRVRDLALRRAQSFIEENAKRPLTVRDLSRAAGVSLRTLGYAFHEHFGVSPQAYLKAIRLNGVRRELRGAEVPVVISDEANRWGFWHMGQFAADYRRLFGELPSETLTRSRARKLAPA